MKKKEEKSGIFTAFDFTLVYWYLLLFHFAISLSHKVIVGAILTTPSPTNLSDIRQHVQGNPAIVDIRNSPFRVS